MPQRLIPVGRISGVYGVRGWVRIFSWTRPRDNIVSYQPWYLKQGDSWTEVRLAEGRGHGKGVVARLEGCTDREAAHKLIGAEIAVSREQMPDTGPDEYYWHDLQGLQVINLQDELLGRVDHLLETGANDVLVVSGERERLIPFVTGQTVQDVDLDAGVIRVDWDKDF